MNRYGMSFGANECLLTRVELMNLKLEDSFQIE